MAVESENLKLTIEELGRYAPPAFDFLREGLDFTSNKIHGAADPRIERLAHFLMENQVEPLDLPMLVDEERLPEPVLQAIDAMGGVHAVMSQLNRHVTGRDLCWGLRDYAMEQWGLMAPAVLHSWGITSTRDFGRMVFGLVNKGVLQKQPEDNEEDFDNVYSFDNAFSSAYKIRIGNDPKDN